ncbi:hypothetical protein AB2L27_04990 [Kineococcus sp. LSe6-4]|uniref:DUF202 domain-containing protein n=1 Tax=Kineococcus halophytocola TaxID=3234027 RepID=A0ABV4GXU0_9ACTN
MHHLVDPLLDGSLAALFPPDLARALGSWLGLVLLVAAGLGALALDLTSRPVPATTGGTPAPGPTTGPRRALLALTVVCAAGAALATLVRFALVLS